MSRSDLQLLHIKTQEKKTERSDCWKVLWFTQTQQPLEPVHRRTRTTRIQMSVQNHYARLRKTAEEQRRHTGPEHQPRSRRTPQRWGEGSQPYQVTAERLMRGSKQTRTMLLFHHTPSRGQTKTPLGLRPTNLTKHFQTEQTQAHTHKGT